MQNKPNLPNAQINVTSVITKDYENKSNWTLGENEPNSNPISKSHQKMNKKRKKAVKKLTNYNKNMQNEPNLQNAQKNVSSFTAVNYGNFHLFAHRKNEPNLWKTNPIYEKQPQPVRHSFSEGGFAVSEQFPLIYVLFFLIFTNFYTNSPSIYELSTLHSNENPNFHTLDQQKRTQYEPNLTIQRDTLHASRDTLKLTQFARIGQFEDKKMQNEPNFKNAQINLSPAITKNYENNRLVAHRKNEPNLCPRYTNPIYAQGIQTKFAVAMLFWPAVRNFSIYSGQGLHNTVGSSSRLPAKTAYPLPITNKKMQNEPNFKSSDSGLAVVVSARLYRKRIRKLRMKKNLLIQKKELTEKMLLNFYI